MPAVLCVPDEVVMAFFTAAFGVMLTAVTVLWRASRRDRDRKQPGEKKVEP